MMPALQEAQAAMDRLLDREVRRIFQVGDMTCFIFGAKTSESEASEWALHVLRGWRLEYRERTVTGAYDYFDCTASPSPLDGNCDSAKEHSYLDYTLRELLCDRLNPNEAARDVINRGAGFTVSIAKVSPNGDCSIHFTNGYIIRILPLAGRGEAWVVFQHGKGEEGFSMYMEDLS